MQLALLAQRRIDAAAVQSALEQQGSEPQTLEEIYTKVKALIESDAADEEILSFVTPASKYLVQLAPDVQMNLAWHVLDHHGDKAFQDVLFELPAQVAMALSVDQRACHMRKV